MADETTTAESMEAYGARRLAAMRAPPALAKAPEAPVIDPKNALPPLESEAVDDAAKLDKTDGTSGDEPDGEATDGPDDTSGEGNEKIPGWVKGRITREANKARAAEELAAKQVAEKDAEIARLAALVPKPVDPKTKPRPTRDDFDDPDAYETALLDWNAEQVRASVTEEADQRRVFEDRARQVEATLNTFRERRTAFEADHKDFAALVDSEDLKISPVMSQVILTAEDGPAIAYHLGKNPEVAERIAGLAPELQLYEIGRISARLAAPPVQPKPRPVTPLGSRNSEAADPNDETMEQYGARRLRELRTAH